MTEQLITKDELVRALYAAWPHTVFSQALEDATGLPRGATIDFETAAAAGASFAGLERWADVVLEVLADRLATLQRQDERVRELEAALDARTWHDEHDKSISKQPNANTGDNGWRRMQHQEQSAQITATLKDTTHD